MPDSDEWRARAIALAEDRHLTGTVRYLGTAHSGVHEVYRVPSTRRDDVYEVVYDRVAGTFDRRHCTAASHEHPCCHVGAVLHSVVFRYRRGEVDVHEREWLAQMGASEKLVDDLEQRQAPEGGGV